ncbi:phospholipase D-like domain-containing protein [Frankia sp. Cppng1_Ct_nod]|uniref:phospholipase D-like domain-containing protein n=1 Tax=Frankia sp. Cppng1_Ct_nod TaxID=2897162 RepID=UPI002024D07B|nr:phospholipase D-like domain-containing protein [Frankia sp. Cppng1_Ct_nod]
MTGTHHQKATIVCHDNVVTAFVGGMDNNPLHLDSAPHNSRAVPAPAGGTVPWGWHDAGVRLVGGAAAEVWNNFADRWQEACTLPPTTLLVRDSTDKVKKVPYTPPAPVGVGAPPTSPPPAATADTSIQVLRSRYRTKLDRPGNRLPWLTRGGGEILEVFETLGKAIDAATRYIYIEDQFLGDHPVWPALGLANPAFWLVVDSLVDPRLPHFTLLPHILAALNRNVRVIFVGSGYADPGDAFAGPKNLVLPPDLASLASVTTTPGNLAVWRLEGTTVHAKLMLIDDEFAAVGSANMNSRSMLGVDQELHTAVVTTGDLVKTLRVDLWREHLGIVASLPAVESALGDLTLALGMWRSAWSSGGMWFSSNNPAGYDPATMGPGSLRTRVVRAYVGPGTTP